MLSKIVSLAMLRSLCIVDHAPFDCVIFQKSTFDLLEGGYLDNEGIVRVLSFDHAKVGEQSLNIIDLYVQQVLLLRVILPDFSKLLYQ